ncbi:putative drug exporter of the RND superfamily [Actinopolyspora xinjiangensis]|uniref:Putative drug exporter of the RND superfamily n=1 Tax=Actinopolyspora xinjiangensis TaxID=405564 RepID=A0A1H0VAA5_9ACTN|nr:hypothetical protein [Actinopolyspora xinjiangensis]SDP75499.1 putative drug exporter of the RND superfamily [Actinopolyspora xinjiangensis]
MPARTACWSGCGGARSLGLSHLIALFARFDTFAVNVASQLEPEPAIDYGLFLVGRFRE